jgi:hypothetical protein
MIRFAHHHRRFLCSLPSAVVVLSLARAWTSGGQLCASTKCRVTLPRDLVAESVSFPSASSTTTNGWIGESLTKRTLVVLQHGVRSDRSSMVERALILSTNLE